MNRSRHDYRTHPLYRDSKRGMILGVCAGIAGYFDWSLALTRFGALVLGWFFTVPTIVAYIVAALLMPERRSHFDDFDDFDDDHRASWHHRYRSRP